jgi:tRNA pseudouridine38-40 synthase
MSRYKLVVEYVGTRYSGWQVQANARTVQGELLRAAEEALGWPPLELYGSGRTDAGVHALWQVAHLEADTRLEPHALRHALNDGLPADVNVIACARVPHRFHARHDAVARSYLYQVARRRTAFGKPFVWWVKDELDVDRMRETAALFAGMHDFRSFTDEEQASTRVRLEPLELAEHGDLILVRVRGSHFVWKMVRRLVGVLVEAGRATLGPADVQAWLDGDFDDPARLTAPPSGLFLERVFYAGDPQDLPLLPAMGLGVARDEARAAVQRPVPHPADAAPARTRRRR